MEKALTYIQNRRPDMMTYLEDGRCSFCNNLSEIEVKPVGKSSIASTITKQTPAFLQGLN